MLLLLEYNEVFKVLIDRKQSAFKRFCRRGVINFKLHYVRLIFKMVDVSKVK